MRDTPTTRHIKYICTNCGDPQIRDDLTVKRVSFQTIGTKFKILRSRNVDWLCPSCRDGDPDWLSPKFAASPGMANTKMNADG